ncbi:hypothetical protein [Yinghuangia sp. YIM S09857]|uniref:hypothetical protein n=1 Tax=Yinghuangia sp. YIM S09857 TaxID=3436929 RepID=UPI003F539AC0
MMQRRTLDITGVAMRFRRFGGRRPGVSTRRRSVARWIVVAVGLGTLVAALVAAAGPFRETRDFRATVTCEKNRDDCFDSEAGSITGRRTYTTTSTDSEGNTTTTTHHEVTWQRADGSRETRDVSTSFYKKAREGEPATLRLWHGDVVAVEVMGAKESFLPEAAGTLALWLYAAYFGLGVFLWGLLFGWWDGFFMLFFRTLSWMFAGIFPVMITTSALAYGLNGHSASIGTVVFGVFFTGIAVFILTGSLDNAW